MVTPWTCTPSVSRSRRERIDGRPHMSRTCTPGTQAILALAVLIFAWPDLSVAYRGTPASYPLVTVLFACAIVAMVVAWPRADSAAPAAPMPRMSAAAIASACIGAAAIAIALYRWTRLMAWLPYGADMLIVIREATRRFLNGHSPYTIYRSYDTPWEMAMPYGPVLGGPFVVLIAARTTMVAVVPVFLMGVWRTDRRRLPAVLIALAGAAAIMLGPFVAWDSRGIWDSMVLSYPRVMAAAVWPVLARPGQETIGLTEWLLEHHRESLVVPVQAIAMLGVYAAAWAALARRLRALPWMALALFAFCITS